MLNYNKQGMGVGMGAGTGMDTGMGTGMGRGMGLLACMRCAAGAHAQHA